MNKAKQHYPKAEIINNNNNNINNYSKSIQNQKAQNTNVIKLNSISSQSIGSSFSMPSLTASSAASSGIELTPFLENSASRSNDKIQNAFNNKSNFIVQNNNLSKEIKNLLEIAENRTKMLCKVYDSTLNESALSQNFVGQNYETNKRQISNKTIHHQELKDHQITNLSKIRANDYKDIIITNYLNSSRKQSNVINKVKLWDELLQSGHLNSDKWNGIFS